MNTNIANLIGQSLFLAGMQASIGSVEMSSKFSVNNFAKDQQTLNSAAGALGNYLVIAFVWTIASMLVLYSEFKIRGIMWGFTTNLIFIVWIWGSYTLVFKNVAKQYGLKQPPTFVWF